MFKEAKYILKKDRAYKSLLEVIFLCPGYHALFFHRLAHMLYNKKLYFFAMAISKFARFVTGIEIHPGAKIGKNVYIDHGIGVVIGETAIVEEKVTIYQGVTLGQTGKEAGFYRHPTIKKNVIIGAGAKILGQVTVYENSKIGAGAIVTKNVPKGKTVICNNKII